MVPERHSMLEPVHSTLVRERSMVPEQGSMDRNIDLDGST